MRNVGLLPLGDVDGEKEILSRVVSRICKKGPLLMNNVIIAENNTHPEDDINIAKEFNIILDSVADESSFTHDRYLRFAFANPKRMAELLELYARRKPSLREFLDTINISTLRGVPENFSSDKHAGSADLVFEADLKTGGKAGLFVGISHEQVAEVKKRLAALNK